MKKLLFFLIFPILIIVFILHYWLVEQAVYGDARYYWYFSRSIIIDQDLNLADEANHRYDHLGNNVYKFQNEQPITPPGNPKDEFHQPIGTSIAWLPFFVVADFIARSSSIFNLPILANGYSDIYQIIVGLGAIFLVVLGLWMVYQLSKDLFSSKAARISVLVMLFATNLFYYSSLDVVNSHAISFFLSSLFFYLWLQSLNKRSSFEWLALGFITGFLAATRTQDIIFASVVFLEILWRIFTYFRSLKKEKLNFLFQQIKNAAIFSSGIFIAISPQLLVWKIIYGGFFNVPYLAHKEPFNIFSPHILGVLINTQTGIIPYSPIIILAFLGLFLLAKESKTVSWIFIIFFALEYFIISSWGAWDQASSYGIRMLISTMPILIIGCTAFVDWLLKLIPQRIITALCIVLIMFNFCMIGVFHLFLKEVTYDGGKPTRAQALEKLNKALHINFKFFK